MNAEYAVADNCRDREDKNINASLSSIVVPSRSSGSGIVGFFQ
jgi:hypothetical protein